jgi:primosomal protein N' (replication factor Y)
MTYVDVLFPLALQAPLTYQVAEGVLVKEGMFVRASLGKKSLIGVVWGIKKEKPEGIKNIKAVQDVLDVPPLQNSLRAFISWLADYTLSPIGAVLKLSLVSEEMITKELKEPAFYIWHDWGGCKKTATREKIYNLLLDKKSRSLAQIASEADVGRSVVNLLAQDGVLAEAEPSLAEPKPYVPIELSKEQYVAFEKLWEHYQKKEYATIVLDGVTGSGKTEVYFKLIEQVLASSQTEQILIMLPEIILTSQLVARFERRFGFMPTLWHSSLASSRRIKNWRDIKSGKARLIIGARSSLLLPFASLSAVIVDEEHDGSYKQEEGVVYHARDAAVMRGYREKIPVVLASATPSVETMFNVKNGKYQHVTLSRRHGGALFPELKIIDMREQQIDSGNWISEPLRQEIKSNIEAQKQSILFLNRRGYAPLVLCRACGHRFQCPNCSSWLVMHKKNSSLKCHHCGYSDALPDTCPSCGEEEKLAACGPGVERIHEEVEDLFPDARVLTMTSDQLTTAKAAIEAVDKILNNQVDIIIGTQLIAKGHHFPNLTLVGVIDADLGLSGGDLRASERTFQLLHQVAGRAGREKEKGRVVLQSYSPDNEVLKALKNEQRDKFIDFELQSRKQTNMPPFSRLSGVVISGADQALVRATAQALVRDAQTDDKHIRILGPVEAPIFMLRGKYRFRILLRASRDYNVQGWIANWLYGKQIASSVKVKVDIDPQAFF